MTELLTQTSVRDRFTNSCICAVLFVLASQNTDFQVLRLVFFPFPFSVLMYSFLSYVQLLLFSILGPSSLRHPDFYFLFCGGVGSIIMVLKAKSIQKGMLESCSLLVCMNLFQILPSFHFLFTHAL